MLPHAAHARQVVLELRELDLELPLGASRRAGRRCRGSAACGRSRARRARPRGSAAAPGSSSSSTSRLSASERLEALLELLELALADVGALRRAGAVLHDAADRLDAGRARELLDLGELVVGIGSLGQDREDEPALRLRGTWNHRGHYARCQRPTPDSRRDARSRSSTSRRSRATRRRSTATSTAQVPLPARLRRRRVAPLRQARAASRSSCSPATPTRCRRRATCPGRIEDGAVARARRDRHEGRARRDDRARAAGPRDAELAYDLGAALLPARGARARPRTRCPALFERGAADRRGGARRSASSRPTTRSSSAASATSTPGSSSRGARRTRRGRGSASTRSSSRSTGLRGVLELEPRDVDDRRARLPRGAVSVTQIDDGGNATNVIPARVEATLNFRYAPDRDAGGGRGAAARARRARASRSSQNVARRRHVALGSPLVERAARGRRLRRSSRSRPGRTSPTSPPAASTPSTSGPGATRYAHTADEQRRDRRARADATTRCSASCAGR